MQRLWKFKPLFLHWDSVAEQLEALTLVRDFSAKDMDNTWREQMPK